MTTRTLLLLPLLFLGLGAQAPEGKALCGQAESAFFQHQLVRSRELWDQAVRVLPAGEDRGRAEIQLAVLAWRFDGNPVEAARRFEAATSDLPAWTVTLAKARWRREAGDLSGALALCRTALGQACPEEARATVRAAMLRLAPLALQPDVAPLEASDQAFLVEQATALPASPDARREELRERLDLALLAGRGGDVLDAWMALVPRQEGGVGQPLVGRLQDLLPRWTGPGSLPPLEELDLIKALAASRLHPEAAWAAARAKLTAPVARDEEAYAAFLVEVRRLTDAYYQRTALGQGSREAWMTALEGAETRLLSRLDGGGQSLPILGREGMERELRKRFGASILHGSTAGYEDLHYGHILRDLAWTPSQYGHTLGKPSHLITLDFEVSNGCESWLWDGRAAHGGWTAPGGIYQWAADSTLAARAWAVLGEDEAGEASRKEQARLDALDAARPRNAPFGDLRGVQGRLCRKGARLLLGRLRGQGLMGEALRKAFIAEYDHSLEGSGILAHEGRHALDRNSVWTRLRLVFQGAEGLEYRAKLSEIAFAPIPFLAFGGILADNVGDATPHGRANARLLKGLGDWIDDHAARIPGYAPDRPAWLQLDLLTAEQLRDAARSLDPWAPTAGR